MRARTVGLLVGLIAVGLGAAWSRADEPVPPPVIVVTERPPAGQTVILADRDPLLEPEFEPPAGMFGAVDVQVLKPHLKYRLAALMDFGAAGTDVVQLPSASLDWVAMPRFELGCRFPEGMGSFIVAYQPLQSRGDALLSGFGAGGIGDLHTRLNANIIDLDWASREWTVAELLRVQWRLGLRVATMYADSTAADNVFNEHSSNYFYGAGPHVGLDLWQPLPWAGGCGIYARADAASLAGEARQTFEEVVETPGGLIGAGTEFHRTIATPMIALQAGLTWSSGIFASQNVTFSTGYAYEHWWHLGNLNSNFADNKVGLWTQGIFFRGEWRY